MKIISKNTVINDSLLKNNCHLAIILIKGIKCKCTLKEAYMESISMMMMVMYGIAMITMTLGVTGIIGIIGYLNNVNITV